MSNEIRKKAKSIAWLFMLVYFASYVTRINFAVMMVKICSDMQELSRVYEIPSMFNDVDIFVKPILKVVMDCIRLTNYLERKEHE